MRLPIMPRLAVMGLMALTFASPALAAPRVITSIMPVHSIVSAVMGDVGTPELLLPGTMSEHRASFTPLQVASLADAGLVFIIGHGLEAKLAQLSGSETVNGKRFIELAGAPGVATLPVREGGAWGPHAHEDVGQSHDETEGVLAFDPHVWLDPQNAIAMARAVAAELTRADPANATAYAANAEAFAEQVDAAAADITALLAPVKDRPFIVFHDAYQYFETRFNLNGVGSIADVSAAPPSAERLKAVRDKLVAVKAVCVFREPQYDGKVVETVIEGSTARAAVLDPVGAGLEPGPAAYQQLIRNLALQMADCLGG